MDLAFQHNSSIKNFPLFRMASERVIIRTPISIRLPLSTSSTETETAVLLVDMSKFRNHFLVKDDEPAVHCVTCSNHNLTWKSHGRPFKDDKDITAAPPPPPLLPSSSMDLTPQPPSNATIATTIQSDNSSDESSGVSVLEPEAMERELSQSLQNQLRIGEFKEMVPSAPSKLPKSRVYKHRKWKWTAPINLSGSKITISSRNEFKMIFFCIFMKDTNRVLSSQEIRKILHQLGYEGVDDEYGPLNSARSYMKHFKRCGLYQPKGSKTFLEMIKDVHKMNRFMKIADFLLSNLE